MKVKMLAAAGALVLGLAGASEAQAAGCSCKDVRPHKVARHHAQRAPVVQTVIVYGESRGHRAPRAAPAEYAEDQPSEPFYADPAYSDPAVYGSVAYYTYGYGAPLARGMRLAGYRPYGYRANGDRPHGYARDGWRGGYAGRGGGPGADRGDWRR